jgi:hypothetical protein
VHVQATRTVLIASCAVGIVTVAAVLAGFTRIAAGGAAFLLLTFLLLPWMGRR